MKFNADFESRLDGICRSDRFQAWRERLTVCWDQKPAKDAVILEAREAIAADGAGLSEQEASNLQRAAISRLIGGALQAMNRSGASPEAGRARPSRQDLEMLVIRKFPYPIAGSYRRLSDAESPAGAFVCLLDTFESLLYFLTTVLLSHYWREGAPDAENNRRLLRKLYKGALSIGDLMELMRETARLYLSRSDALPYPQLVGTLFKPNGDVTSTLRVLEEFVAIRNEKLAHGAGRDDRFYASIIDENRYLLDGTLARFEWLAARALYLPKKVSDEGRVTLADVFEGDFRSKSRPIDLQLSPSDLHSNGGDVVADKTLLLVDEASEHYLPLFPLALFHFQTKGQDIYPAGKFVFYRPADRPVTGGIPLARREGDIKEAMLQDWLGAVIANNVKINEEEPFVAVKNENGYFEVVTERGPKRDRTTYKARKVIIAIGNRGEPMKLRVPGEELRMFVQPEPERARCCPKCGAAKTGEYFDCARCGEKLPVRTLPAFEDSKVKYKLTDPETYSNKKCMVVAAGNSGVEAAVALAGLERRGDQITFARNNDVTIVVRSDFKNDITLRNKMDLYDCMDAGRIEVYYQSTIKEIKENEVILEDPRTRQEKARIMNDYVFAFLGSEKSIRFLENLGIRWAY